MTRKNFMDVAGVVADGRHVAMDALNDARTTVFNEDTNTNLILSNLEQAKALAAARATAHLAKGLADYFATQNPNFNRYLFLKACGVMA